MLRLPVLPILLLLAVLQGLAPLLHDHLGGPQPSAGIHAHFGVDDAGQPPVVGNRQQASSEEFPDVGIGQLIERRIHLGVSLVLVVVPVPPVVHAVADIPALRVAQLVAAPPPPAARSLPPPALAPPFSLA